MTYSEPLSQLTVAISVSDSQELGRRGLGPEHLRDVTAEIARHLLAMGARLVYGGDLRSEGFTELLFELIARYGRDSELGDQRNAVLNFFAWPVYATWGREELEQLNDHLRGLAQIKLLDRNGHEVEVADHVKLDPRDLHAEDWALGLSAMRRKVTQVSDARIVLGGRTSGFMGTMPGIAEEAACALEEGQPLFVLGGFGGCALDIAADLGLIERHHEAKQWPGRQEFRNLSYQNLQNGLNASESRVLAKTVHVDEAVGLILRGLMRLSKNTKFL